MSESDQKTLPTESQSQKIGRLGLQAFRANAPGNWIVGEAVADTDYGLDALVQVVDHEDALAGLFHVQIKGTESPSLSANGDRISISLGIATLNYYMGIGDPVMLVLADLSKNEVPPKDCDVYWYWITEQIREVLRDPEKRVASTQKTVSLVGKGEQNCVKVKLAIGAEESCEVLLLEEPENHLPHVNLNAVRPGRL